MRKTTELQTILTVLFVAALMVSNVITSRQILFPFGIAVSGGVMVFPITYVLSDVFSEVYGYRWSRITCYLAFAMNLLMVLIFTSVIKLPYPSFFEGADAFSMTLGNTPRVLLGSFTAFIMGDLVNDRVFRRMKMEHPDSLEGFGFRAILSSIAGELVDSAIFFPIAFMGQMPAGAILTMAVIEVVMKVAYEVAILPFTRYVAGRVATLETA